MTNRMRKDDPVRVAGQIANSYVLDMARALASTPVADEDRRVVVIRGGGVALGKAKRKLRFKEEALHQRGSRS